MVHYSGPLMPQDAVPDSGGVHWGGGNQEYVVLVGVHVGDVLVQDVVMVPKLVQVSQGHPSKVSSAAPEYHLRSLHDPHVGVRRGDSEGNGVHHRGDGRTRLSHTQPQSVLLR